MRLDNFEEKIDDTILKRGITYWKRKLVVELEQDGKKVEAWVRGTEDYRVKLEIDKKEITWHSCTCPYDGGSVCKHIAAVLFEVTNIETEAVTERPSRRGRPQVRRGKVVRGRSSTPKKKSKKPQFKTLIQELNEDELRTFIIDLASSDRQLKDRFMAFFAHKWSSGNKEDYKVIFRNIMRGYMGRDGFLNYYNSGRFASEIISMMAEIPQWIDTSPKNALALCQTVIEESHKVYEAGVDDSSGEFGSLSSLALDYLKQLSEKAAPDLKEEIFIYCASESRKKIYSDYGDAWLEFMEIIIPLTDSKERMTIVFESLNEKLKSSSEWSRSFYTERVANIKYKILTELEPDKAAILKAEHIKFPSFRKAAIKKAIQKKDFNSAKKLAEDGVIDDKGKAGLVRNWKEYLYTIAIKTKDEVTALELAEYFFAKRHRNIEDFHRLKKHYPQEKWNEKVTSILTELSGGKNNWYGYGITHDICVEEERWEILKNNLFNATSFETLKYYGKYIITHFNQETLRDMYALVVVDKMKNATKRSKYNDACKGIRQMKPLSDKAFIEKFIQSFKDKYPRRVAMIDELNRI